LHQQKQDIWSTERGLWCTSMMKTRWIWPRGVASKYSRKSTVKLKQPLILTNSVDIRTNKAVADTA
jgi:hypothetical protein